MRRTPSPTRPSSLVLGSAAGLSLALVSGCCIQNPLDFGPKLQVKEDEQAMRELLLDLFPLGASRREVLRTIDRHDIEFLEYKIAGTDTQSLVRERVFQYGLSSQDEQDRPVYAARRLDRLEVKIPQHIKHFLPGCTRLISFRFPFLAAGISFDDSGVSHIEVWSYSTNPNDWIPYEFEITADD